MKENKVGRPVWIPDEKALAQVESLAAQGLTQEQIADCLGIGLSTLCDKKNKFPEFLDAIKRGQAKGIATVANALFNDAKNGNTTAQIFYLKSRASWKETHIIAGDKDNPIELNNNINIKPTIDAIKDRIAQMLDKDIA